MTPVAGMGVLNPPAGPRAAHLPWGGCLARFAPSSWWSYTFSQHLVYQSKPSATSRLAEVHLPKAFTPGDSAAAATRLMLAWGKAALTRPLVQDLLFCPPKPFASWCRTAHLSSFTVITPSAAGVERRAAHRALSCNYHLLLLPPIHHLPQVRGT